jgi:hypothetical protein
MFKSGHAANVGAVLQMVLIAGSGTLDKGNGFRLLVVAGTENFALGGSIGSRQTLHHHVGDNGGRRIVFQIGNLIWIIRIPASRPDNGTYLQGEGFGLHVEINRIIFARGFDCCETFCGAGLFFQDIPTGKGHFMGQIDRLGFSHAEIEFIVNLVGAGLGAIAAGGCNLILM